MIGIFKRKKGKGKGKIYYSLKESRNNKVIKQLVLLIKLCRYAKNPIDINKEGCVTKENSVLICHTYIEKDTHKEKFIDDRINSPNWWKEFIPDFNEKVIYLFSCKGYFAIYWNTFNFYTPNLIAYNTELGMTLDLKIISDYIKEYFCSVINKLTDNIGMVSLKNTIIEEKTKFMDRIKEAMILADQNNKEMELLILKFQLVCGFQNNSYSLILINKRKKWNLD